MSYSSEVLSDSPAMYLRLGESSGTNANDETANNNDGTYQNTPTLGATGPLHNDANTAVTLNGSTQYITVADHATLDTADVMTVEFWLKTASVGVVRVADKGTNAYVIKVDTGFMLLQKEGVASIAASTVAVNDDAWHHVAVAKNAATTNIYVDGVDRTGAVTDQTLASNATNLAVGSNPGGSADFFPGSVDEVAVYPTALTAARVLAHFNAGITGELPRPSFNPIPLMKR